MSNVVRVLEDTQAVITQYFFEDGTESDVGTVALTATDLAGDAFTLSAPAASISSSGSPVGYDYTWLKTEAANPTVLNLLWSSTNADLRHRLEVVRSKLLTEDELRDFSPALAAAAANSPSDERLLTEVWRATDRLERWTGRSWAARYRRWTFKGNGTDTVDLYDALDAGPGFGLGASNGEGAWHDLLEVLSASLDGSSVATTDLEVLEGRKVRRTDGGSWSTPSSSAASANVVLEGVYGRPYTEDGVEDIVATIVRNTILRPPGDDRTISQGGGADVGTTRLVLEGGPQRNPTRWPVVNQWIADHDVRPWVG